MKQCKCIGVMRSRSVTYTLLIVALGVWGVVLWKVLFSKPESINVELPSVVRVTSPLNESDTLWLDYPDPFLREIISTVKDQQTNAVKVKHASKTVKQEAPNVQLGCAGRICKRGVNYYLVSIGGRGYLLQEGGSAQGYRLQRLINDSLILVCGDHTYSVKVP